MAFYVKTLELLNRHNSPRWKKEITRVFEREELTPWLSIKDQPKTTGKSAVDEFRINQSKSRTLGITKAILWQLYRTRN